MEKALDNRSQRLQKWLREMGIWFLKDSGMARGLVIAVICLTAFFYYVPGLMKPAVASITTVHDIYFPPGIQVVDNVYAGDIMWVEKNFSSFQKEEKEKPVQFLNIRGYSSFTLNYYAKKEDSSHVVHSFTEIEGNQPANRWSVYTPISYEIKGGKMLIAREWSFTHSAFICLLAGICLTIIGAVLINFLVSYSLFRLYRKMF